MSDPSTHANESKPATSGSSLPLVAAAIMAVLALIGGIWLGRVAFVSNEEAAPRVVAVEVEDEELELSGRVEYFEDRELYLLTINTMPPAADGQVYAVWVQTGDIVVCAGILNSDSKEFAYAAYSGRYESLFVTEESGPYCGEQPTSDPLITADLTELEDEDD